MFLYVFVTWYHFPHDLVIWVASNRGLQNLLVAGRRSTPPMFPTGIRGGREKSDCDNSSSFTWLGKIFSSGACAGSAALRGFVVGKTAGDQRKWVGRTAGDEGIGSKMI